MYNSRIFQDPEKLCSQEVNMKLLKKTILATVLTVCSMAAPSLLAQPVRNGPSPDFSVRHIDGMATKHFAYNHFSPIGGHDGWYHHGGHLYNGPYWHGSNYWYWNNAGGSWGWGAYPTGVALGATVGLLATGCCGR